MRYSFEPRDRIYVKGYGFLSFAKNMDENLSNKYGQKRLDKAKKNTTEALKAASKRAIPKTAEATGDLIHHKIADKTAHLQNDDANKETEAPKKDTYLQKKGNKFLKN